MESPANIDSSEDYEEEYDVFYDELRKQVLQLTAEEDEGDEGVFEGVYERKMMDTIEARKWGPVLRPICYTGWPGPARSKEECSATPAWMVNLWRSNGTGVFIPKGVVQSTRKNRSRRKNGRGRMYREVERMK